MYFQRLEHSQQFTFSNRGWITYQAFTTTVTSHENLNSIANFAMTALLQHNEANNTEKIFTRITRIAVQLCPS